MYIFILMLLLYLVIYILNHYTINHSQCAKADIHTLLNTWKIWSTASACWLVLQRNDSWSWLLAGSCPACWLLLSSLTSVCPWLSCLSAAVQLLSVCYQFYYLLLCVFVCVWLNCMNVWVVSVCNTCSTHGGFLWKYCVVLKKSSQDRDYPGMCLIFMGCPQMYFDHRLYLASF